MSHVFMTFRVASRAKFKCFRVFVGGARELNFCHFLFVYICFYLHAKILQISVYVQGDQNGVQTCGGKKTFQYQLGLSLWR